MTPLSAESSVDVAIIGGGPAGLATALAVRKELPKAKIVVLERTSYDKFRPGETIPAPIQKLFDQLDIREEFEAQNYLSAFGNATNWGSDEEVSDPSVYHAWGNGWHLDRPKFDQWLVDVCKTRNIEVLTHVSYEHTSNENGYQLKVSGIVGNKMLHAKVVVDATGAKAKFATSMGSQAILHDKLSAFYLTLKPDNSDKNSYTNILSSEFGWWYTCQRKTGRVVAFFTDNTWANDNLAMPASELAAALHQLLPPNSTLQNWFSPEKVAVLPTRHSAHSQEHSACSGNNWISVGDAAICYDPLSGQGIFKAFHTAILASYAISDYLIKNTSEGFEKYRWIIQQEFEGYQKMRSYFYEQEQRWKASPFWKNRNKRISLEPNASLFSAQKKANQTVFGLSKSEQLQILAFCKSPQPAMNVVKKFSEDGRNDTRLIHGIQEMIRCELLLV